MVKSQVKETILNKKNSYYLKALAIIMMITHHLFGFPDWIKINLPYYELTIFGISIWFLIGKFCKICVSIFAFISGIGLYFSFCIKREKFRYVLKKIVSLIIIYEITFIFFILPINLFFKDLTFNEIIDNFLMRKSSLIYTSWYIIFYIKAIMFIFLYHVIPIKKSIMMDLIICFLIPILLNIISPNNIFGHYFPIFSLGYLFSKYQIFNIFENKIIDIKFRISIMFLFLFLAIIIKTYFGESFLNISTITFVTPPLCYLLSYFVEFIIHLKTIKKILFFLSKYSTLYWLVHVIFHSDIILFQKILYFPKVPFLIIAWAFILLAPVVIVLSNLYTIIMNLLRNVKNLIA